MKIINNILVRHYYWLDVILLLKQFSVLADAT